MAIDGATISVLLWMALVAPILAISALPAQVAIRGEDAQQHDAPTVPRRVVIYPPLLAPYVTIDETTDNVKAASFAARDGCTAIFERIFPRLHRLAEIATLGRKSIIPGDPEQVLLMEPDAVIVWASATGGLEKTGVPLKKIATTDPVEISKALGDIAGKEPRAAQLVETFNNSAAVLMAAIERIDRGKAQHAIVMWRNDEESWRVASVRHRSAQTLERLGAEPAPRPVASKDVPISSFQVNSEWLLAADPDVIFISCCARLSDDPRVVYRQPELQALKAVRERRIYKLPVGASHMDGVVEWPLLERWYAELLYPDQLNATLRDRFRETFARLYGYTVNDDELDAMLSIDENSRSSGYARFSKVHQGRASGHVMPPAQVP